MDMNFQFRQIGLKSNWEIRKMGKYFGTDGMEAVNEACRMGRDALGKLVPLRPYPDGDKNIMACPRCGSGEYLHNEDGNEQNFCGQCGQAIEWR